MIKRMPIMIATVLASAFFALSCQEPLVGAPCVPETDKGVFETTLSNTTNGVETRSVQCETSVCITTTKVVGQPDESEETTYDQYRGTQIKYSFCSCRCANEKGQTWNRKNDELDDLCVCPGNSVCEEILEPTVGVAENIAGSYCIPRCILSECPFVEEGDEVARQVCTPSSNDESPWAWRCKDPS